MVNPLLRHSVVQRVVWVRRAEERLDAQQHGSDLQCRRPVLLQNIQTNSTQFVHIRVVYFSQKTHFRRHHGIVVRQEKLEVEKAAFEGTLNRSCDLNMEITGVSRVWVRVNARHWFIRQFLRFLDEFYLLDPSTQSGHLFSPRFTCKFTRISMNFEHFRGFRDKIDGEEEKR